MHTSYLSNVPYVLLLCMYGVHARAARLEWAGRRGGGGGRGYSAAESGSMQPIMQVMRDKPGILAGMELASLARPTLSP